MLEPVARSLGGQHVGGDSGTPCPGLPLAVSLIYRLPRDWRELKDDCNKIVQRV